jgi:hypothetical protein
MYTVENTADPQNPVSANRGYTFYKYVFVIQPARNSCMDLNLHLLLIIKVFFIKLSIKYKRTNEDTFSFFAHQKSTVFFI